MRSDEIKAEVKKERERTETIKLVLVLAMVRSDHERGKGMTPASIFKTTLEQMRAF